MLRNAPPPVCLVVGTSGGGKTTLVEKLVAELTSRGFTVATAKGHKEPILLDRPGKDTWRHRRAGAAMTFLVAGSETTAFIDRDLSSDPDKLTLLCPPGIDLLLAEGFKTHTGRPKIAVSPVEVDPTDPNLLCIADDSGKEWAGVLRFGRDEVGRLADLIVARVMGR